MNTREREVMSMSRHSRAMLLNVLWHHQGASSAVGQPIRALLGIGENDALNDEQVAEAKWIDALLAEGSAKEKCFCDEKYSDSNRAATCGDCPRDYRGSASGEGAEAVAYCDPSDPMNRTAFAWPGTDREERHSCALYTNRQPEQGEPGLRDAYEGAREDLLDWKGRAQRAEARLRNLGWAGVDASEPPAGEHEQRSCEGSERRPIADEESAHPRGLPAGSDAVRELVEACEAEFGCDAEVEGERLFPDDDKVSFPEERCNITFGHIRRARAALDATAEQPSCGQDARDAYILRNLPGSVLRALVGELSDTSDVVQFRSRLDEALATATPAASAEQDARDAWQPIETAPKDRRIVLYCPKAGEVVGNWNDNRYAKKPNPYWTNDREHTVGVLAIRADQPTHWRERSVPAAIAAQQRQGGAP